MGKDLLMAQISEQGHGMKPSKPDMQFNEFLVLLQDKIKEVHKRKDTDSQDSTKEETLYQNH